jgi:hypothetical protein
MTKKHFTITLIIALIAGSIGFFGGSTLASGKGNTSPNPNFARNGANGNFARGNRQGTGGGMINGTILSKDDQSITLKLQDGGSKIVFLSATTDISKFVKGTADDLAVGTNVMVNGTTNSDGSVTSKMIQIRPEAPRPTENGQAPTTPSK